LRGFQGIFPLCLVRVAKLCLTFPGVCVYGFLRPDRLVRQEPNVPLRSPNYMRACTSHQGHISRQVRWFESFLFRVPFSVTKGTRRQLRAWTPHFPAARPPPWQSFLPKIGPSCFLTCSFIFFANGPGDGGTGTGKLRVSWRFPLALTPVIRLATF